jgi:endo-1,4-beta-xylanase
LLLRVQLFRLWFSHPAVKGIIMWGWWDANIWSTNAGIYRADKTPKQAALAIQQLWDQEFSTSLEMINPAVDSSGWLQFKGFYGTYAVEYVAADGQAVRRVLQLGRNSTR